MITIYHSLSLSLSAPKIGFENITVIVSEGSGVATLYVVDLGTVRLGGEVTIYFYTADITAANAATGNGNTVSLCNAILSL